MAQVFYYSINLDYEKHSVLQFEFHVPFPPPVYVAVHHHLFPEQKFPFTFHCYSPWLGPMLTDTLAPYRCSPIFVWLMGFKYLLG